MWLHANMGENCDNNGANRHQSEQSRFLIFVDCSPAGFVGIFDLGHIFLL